MNRKLSKIINLTLVYTILIIISLFILYPIVYVLSAAFTPGQSIVSLNIVPFAKGFTLEHFKHLFNETNYKIWYKNTLIIASSTAFFTVLFSSLSAYVFSRFKFVFKKGMLMSFLILQIFPSFVGMIAIYVILLRLNALNTLWGLVLVYIAGNLPFNIWLVKSYLDTISKNLDEAARIDGASNLRIFMKIVMPLAKPIITFLAITSFTAPWMDFIFPKMILRSADKQTLALGLFSFVTDRKNEFANFAAGSILVAVPFMIFFIIGQKMMVTSLGTAAVKE